MRQYKLAALALAITTSLAAGTAQAAEPIVQFNGGIGADPVAGIDANGAPVLNTVRGVAPGGRAWVIRKLKATVHSDGTLTARGSGLIFSGSEAIGTRGGVAAVQATLFCSGVPFDSEPAPLDLAGNFSIKSRLGAVPQDCVAPVLLIRNAAGARNWFAAGIPGTDDD
jgi:hypothetical protein